MPLKVCLIEITEKCPLACEFCFVSKTNKKDMIFSDFKKIIDNLPKTIERLELTGGEPFIHPQLIKFCGYASENLTKPFVFTSGVIVNKKILSKLKPYISGIKVTLRSSNPDKDEKIRGYKNSYCLTLKTLELCNELGIPAYIHYVVMSKQEINEIKKIAKGYNASTEFLPLIAKNQPLIYEYPKSYCTAGVLRCAIDVNGNVMPCVYIRKTFGNILNNNINIIIKNMYKWREKFGECKKECIAYKIIQ